MNRMKVKVYVLIGFCFFNFNLCSLKKNKIKILSSIFALSTTSIGGYLFLKKRLEKKVKNGITVKKLNNNLLYKLIIEIDKKINKKNSKFNEEIEKKNINNEQKKEIKSDLKKEEEDIQDYQENQKQKNNLEKNEVNLNNDEIKNSVIKLIKDLKKEKLKLFFSDKYKQLHENNVKIKKFLENNVKIIKEFFEDKVENGSQDIKDIIYNKNISEKIDKLSDEKVKGLQYSYNDCYLVALTIAAFFYYEFYKNPSGVEETLNFIKKTSIFERLVFYNEYVGIISNFESKFVDLDGRIKTFKKNEENVYFEEFYNRKKKNLDKEIKLEEFLKTGKVFIFFSNYHYRIMINNNNNNLFENKNVLLFDSSFDNLEDFSKNYNNFKLIKIDKYIEEFIYDNNFYNDSIRYIFCENHHSFCKEVIVEKGQDKNKMLVETDLKFQCTISDKEKFVYKNYNDKAYKEESTKYLERLNKVRKLYLDNEEEKKIELKKV